MKRFFFFSPSIYFSFPTVFLYQGFTLDKVSYRIWEALVISEESFHEMVAMFLRHESSARSYFVELVANHENNMFVAFKGFHSHCSSIFLYFGYFRTAAIYSFIRWAASISVEIVFSYLWLSLGNMMLLKLISCESMAFVSLAFADHYPLASTNRNAWHANLCSHRYKKSSIFCYVYQNQDALVIKNFL